MARISPAAQLERILQAIRAWKIHAPDRKFWGMTLAQFEAKAKPGLDADATVTRLRGELRIALAERRIAHARSLRLINRIGRSVKGDPDFGPDSQLLEDLGYTREAVLSSKLRGKKRKRTR
jgi:hypothetical protein